MERGHRVGRRQRGPKIMLWSVSPESRVSSELVFIWRRRTLMKTSTFAVYAPYWSTEPGFVSTIEMMNYRVDDR